MADSTMWLMTEFFYQKELNKWEVINDLRDRKSVV